MTPQLDITGDAASEASLASFAAVGIAADIVDRASLTTVRTSTRGPAATE